MSAGFSQKEPILLCFDPVGSQVKGRKLFPPPDRTLLSAADNRRFDLPAYFSSLWSHRESEAQKAFLPRSDFRLHKQCQTAALAPVFAQMFHRDISLGAEIVSLSTILCLFTLPIIIMLSEMIW